MEGNIKFLCSDLFGVQGLKLIIIEIYAGILHSLLQGSLKKNQHFLNNSTWFLLGSSIIPFTEIPLRSKFEVQLSDHIDNYE